MYATWQPVDLNTPWGDFAPGAVLFYTDETAVVVDARRVDEKIKIKIQRLDGERFEEDVKKGKAMGSTATSLLPDGTVRGIALPAVIWQEDKLTSPRNIFALLVTAAVTTILLALTSTVSASTGSFVYLAFMAGGGAGVYARRMWKGGKVSFMAPDRLGLSMSTIHPYALTREQGRLWVSPSPGADRRGLAYQRVAAIRDSYLELREDIAYRIEVSALFDPKVPTTAEFEAALVTFDDVTDLTPTDELDDLATEVEVAFNVAQANAERLGLAHLPEHARGDARRAGKAARLAAGASTDGERQASLTQVKRILDSLALYYLPTIDEKLAIEGGP